MKDEQPGERLRLREALKPPTRFDDYAMSYLSVDIDEPSYEKAITCEWMAVGNEYGNASFEWKWYVGISEQSRSIWHSW